MSKLESFICKAELAYKSGRTRLAIKHANAALKVCTENSKTAAMKIFIARAYSKLGCYDKSNTIYRGLLKENVYIAPVIMGLLYNNFKTASAEKMNLNIKLIKVLIR